MGAFDTNNKYGRPIPYVWFLILMVSSIPFIMFSGVESQIDCKNIGSNETPIQYLKQHGFTVDEGKRKCNDVLNQVDIVKSVAGIPIFGMLLWRLKPYPLSDHKN